MTPTQKLIEAAEDALRALNTPHVHLTQGGRITAALEMAVAAAKQEQQADPLDPWLAKIMRHMTDAELERLKELAGIVLSESKPAPEVPSMPVAWLAHDGARQLFIVQGSGPHDVYGGFPVYTHPSPPAGYVPMTDEEHDQIYKEHPGVWRFPTFERYRRSLSKVVERAVLQRIGGRK